jgi:hypothetical protein
MIQDTGMLRKVTDAAADMTALLVQGGSAEVHDDSLFDVIFLEGLLLCLTWTAVLGLCRRKRMALQTTASRLFPGLIIDPSLRLLNGSVADMQDRLVSRSSLTQNTLGRWLALLAYACTTYLLYQPALAQYFSAVGGPCPDQECMTSCRKGRKLHVGVCAIFVLLIPSRVLMPRQGKKSEQLVNFALRLLLPLPGLSSRSLSSCWLGRNIHVLKASPLVNVLKTAVWIFNLEVLLPTGVSEAFTSICFSSAAMSYLLRWTPTQSGTYRTDAAYALATSSIPLLLFSSFVFLYCFFREGRQVHAFLKTSSRRLSE